MSAFRVTANVARSRATLRGREASAQHGGEWRGGFAAYTSTTLFGWRWTVSDEITIAPGETPPVIPSEEDPKYIKHVRCEGARFHVLSWDSNGTHCSQPHCIINKPNDRLQRPGAAGETNGQ